MGNGTDTTGTINITTPYLAKYGSLPIVGDRVAIDMVPFQESGGMTLSRVQSIVTVTAS
jgi:hypothetical protein